MFSFQNFFRYLCLFCIFLLNLSLSAKEDFAKAEETAAKHGQQALENSSDAISICDLERYVHLLASQEYEGRGTGGRGERMATAYLAEFFKGLGIQPAGEKDTYYQYFQVAQGK